MDPFAEINYQIRSERWVSVELRKIVLGFGREMSRLPSRVSFRAPGYGSVAWYNGREG